MSNNLEAWFGGSLADLAEKAGNRLNEVEETIRQCELKSDNAIQKVEELKEKLKLFEESQNKTNDKINKRIHFLENDLITNIISRLEKLESKAKRKCIDALPVRHNISSTEDVDYVKSESQKTQDKNALKQNVDDEKPKPQKTQDKNAPKQNVDDEKPKPQKMQDENVHQENDSLNEKIAKDRVTEQKRMKALRMLDELSVVSGTQ